MATLDQLYQRIARLQKQAETIVAKKAQSVLDDIRAMMERHGLTTADIEAHGKPGKVTRKAASKKAGVAAKAKVQGKLPPKYMNPKTGETWSGHARPPAWIKDVKDRTKFLIDGAAAQAAPAARKPAAKKAAAKKTQAASRKTAAKKSSTGVKAAAKRKGVASNKTATRRPRAKPVVDGAVEQAPAAAA
ncbi:histone family protein nucleoid-structuring protein H-NS [Caballeronia arationis]|uniref:DNA-binding protein H-NS n=1 Tax=Caballeronia arationis TaxID=1777142 RepID=A0A7Z7N650_9BURK|nr:H-NS histone family protein [Caballeronia arationis]SAK44198.1 histone family protein nucleoid-structuring protein H-NS [Caballeronia arationis]SOE88512.1 DNA-binding protein H-NS [Caballeronia arationis]